MHVHVSLTAVCGTEVPTTVLDVNADDNHGDDDKQAGKSDNH